MFQGVRIGRNKLPQLPPSVSSWIGQIVFIQVKYRDLIVTAKQQIFGKVEPCLLEELREMVYEYAFVDCLKE